MHDTKKNNDTYRQQIIENADSPHIPLILEEYDNFKATIHINNGKAIRHFMKLEKDQAIIIHGLKMVNYLDKIFLKICKIRLGLY